MSTRAQRDALIGMRPIFQRVTELEASIQSIAAQIAELDVNKARLQQELVAADQALDREIAKLGGFV